MSLGRRFTLAAAVATALLTLLAAGVVESFVRLGTTQREVTGTFFNAVRGSTALFNAYLDQETGIRGYALTGEDLALEPYRQGRDEVTRQTRSLQSILHDRPDLLAQLAGLTVAAEKWQDEYAEQVLAAVRADGPAAASRISPDGGRALFDEIRRRHDQFEQDVLAVRSAQSYRLESGRRLLASAFGLLALQVIGAGSPSARACNGGYCGRSTPSGGTCGPSPRATSTAR